MYNCSSLRKCAWAIMHNHMGECVLCECCHKAFSCSLVPLYNIIHVCTCVYTLSNTHVRLYTHVHLYTHNPTVYITRTSDTGLYTYCTILLCSRYILHIRVSPYFMWCEILKPCTCMYNCSSLRKCAYTIMQNHMGECVL